MQSSLALMAKFIADYKKRTDLRNNDDPLDDLKRIFDMVLSAHPQHCRGSSSVISAQEELENLIRKTYAELNCEGVKPAMAIATISGAALHCFNPSLSPEQWQDICLDIWRWRYGVGKVRIKKRPAEKIKRDAKTMTPEELIKKHNIKRSYAYRLRAEALKNK